MAKLVFKVYGDALIEASHSRGEIDNTYEEMLAIRDVYTQNPELRKLLESPRISIDEKKNILEELFSDNISKLSMGFMMTILDKARQGELHHICEYVIAEIREYKKIGVAYVCSAQKLSSEQQSAIEKKLLDTTEYERFEMHYALDTSLIGGLIIRIRDRVIDSSIKTKLYEMKKDLLRARLA